MAFTPKDWHDDISTPITAAALEDMESRLGSYTDASVAGLGGGGGISPTLFDAKGDVLVASANDSPARLGVGTNGQALVADSTAALGVKWGAPSIVTSGNIQQSLVDAKGDLIAGLANDTPGRLGVGSDGQVLTADSGFAQGLKWATPVAGSGPPTWTNCQYQGSWGTFSGAYPQMKSAAIQGITHLTGDAWSGSGWVQGDKFARIMDSACWPANNIEIPLLARDDFNTFGMLAIEITTLGYMQFWGKAWIGGGSFTVATSGGNFHIYTDGLTFKAG